MDTPSSYQLSGYSAVGSVADVVCVAVGVRRDEIYCQLCAQVTKNASADSAGKGWQLHALCAGCFLPSREVSALMYSVIIIIIIIIVLFAQ